VKTSNSITSIHILPLGAETKIHTHTRQQARSYACMNSYVLDLTSRTTAAFRVLRLQKEMAFRWRWTTKMSYKQSRTSSKECSWWDADGKTRIFYRIYYNITECQKECLPWADSLALHKKLERETMRWNFLLGLTETTFKEEWAHWLHSHQIHNFYPLTLQRRSVSVLYKDSVRTAL
jgi:hypothetical protein